MGFEVELLKSAGALPPKGGKKKKGRGLVELPRRSMISGDYGDFSMILVQKAWFSIRKPTFPHGVQAQNVVPRCESAVPRKIAAL